MRILPVTTNQQTTSKAKNTNFGKAFIAETPEVVAKVEELLGVKVYPLEDVLRERLSTLGLGEHGNNYCVGQHLRPAQKQGYLAQHPNTYLEATDVCGLFKDFPNVSEIVAGRLDEVLRDIAQPTLEVLEKELSHVRAAREIVRCAQAVSRFFSGL